MSAASSVRSYAGGYAPTSAPSSCPESHFVGSSAALLAVLARIEVLAPHEHLAVLIQGESGTGKSYVARHLHMRSPRARKAFHQVVLSTLDDSIAASDLFGHLSGAYTDARQSRPGHFATANGGTLFLDEIGKASSSVQRKLLHAVEHQEVWPVGADRSVRLDVRLVAATNIDLETLVARGEFLGDLAARLTGFRVRLPALRDRREDIPALVRQFVGLRAHRCGHDRHPPRVDVELMEALTAAPWPNNLRQLDSIVQQLLIESTGMDTLTLDHCTGELEFLRDSTSAALPVTPALVRERMMELKSATAVARSLGVSRWTVGRYLKKCDGSAESCPAS
jgi:DNA-binding NtrC family response regulator